MGLNREQRRAMARQALEGGEIDVQDVDTVEQPPSPVVTPDTALPVGVDPAVIAQIVAATVAAMQQSGAANIGDSVAQAIRDNRKPIPENTDAEYHARSVWHPGGKDVPRPELLRRSYFGKWDHEERKAIPRFEYDPAQLRDDEIETINALTPGQYTVQRADGASMLLRVVDQEDSQGQPFRRILAFPPELFQKDHRNSAPTLAQIRAQLLTPVA